MPQRCACITRACGGRLVSSLGGTAEQRLRCRLPYTPTNLIWLAGIDASRRAGAYILS